MLAILVRIGLLAVADTLVSRRLLVVVGMVGAVSGVLAAVGVAMLVAMLVAVLVAMRTAESGVEMDATRSHHRSASP